MNQPNVTKRFALQPEIFRFLAQRQGARVVVERLSSLAQRMIYLTDSDHCSRFFAFSADGAPVGPSFFISLNRRSVRIRLLKRSQFLALNKKALSRNASFVRLRCRPQSFDCRFIASGDRFAFKRSDFEAIDPRGLDNQRYWRRFGLATIHVHDRLAPRSVDCRAQQHACLIDEHSNELVGGKRELIRVSLALGNPSSNGSFERERRGSADLRPAGHT